MGATLAFSQLGEHIPHPWPAKRQDDGHYMGVGYRQRECDLADGEEILPKTNGQKLNFDMLYIHYLSFRSVNGAVLRNKNLRPSFKYVRNKCENRLKNKRLKDNEGRRVGRNNIQTNFRITGIVDWKRLEQAEGSVQC
jgi:hypothetical protein